MQLEVHKQDIATPMREVARKRNGADVVILAGSVGLEDGWTHGLSRALLPLPCKTIIGDLLAKLQASLDGNCVVCVNGPSDAYKDHLLKPDQPATSLHFIEDKLPRGTAGCVKGSEHLLSGKDILVIGGSIWLEDDPSWMVDEHRRQGNALTIYCIPHQVMSSGGTDTRLRPAGIFCCKPDVLKYIQSQGYQDVKEQLVPALSRDGLRVGAVSLKHQTHQVTDWATYLHAVTRSLASDRFQTGAHEQLAPAVWRGEQVVIAEDARIVGPVVVGHGCRIGSGAVLIGPAILGENSEVSAGAWVVRCVVPPGTSIGEQVTISDYFSPTAVRIEDDGFGISSTVANASRSAGTIGNEEPRASLQSVLSSPAAPSMVVGCVGLLAAFAWAFWPTVVQLWDVWQRDPDYSAGQLVPFAALYMVGTKLRDLQGIRVGLAPLGLVLFGVGFLMDVGGAYYLFASASNYGMVVAFIGLITAMVGTEGLKKLWFPLLFLFLMLPLPGRIHDAVMLPLQEASAAFSGSILEVFGIPVERFGNVLEISGQRIAVAEACNGLRMAMAFLIVTGLVAYVIRRPLWQRIVVLSSSVPIALACNIIRIVVTAALYHAGHAWLAQGIFHDGAGLLMMPLALSMILLELWFLSTLYAPTMPRAAYARGMDRTTPLSAR